MSLTGFTLDCKSVKQTLHSHNSCKGPFSKILLSYAEATIYPEWPATGTKATFSESLFIGQLKQIQEEGWLCEQKWLWAHNIEPVR